MENNERFEKAIKLMSELSEGRESGEKDGYISIEDIRKKYDIYV